MQIKPDFKGKEDLLEYMEADSENIERSFAAAGSLLDRIDSVIGGKNYWQLSYTEMCWLYAAVENFRSKITVETGVGPGSSSLIILKASEDFSGQLWSFDLGIKYGEDEQRPVGFLVDDSLRKRWHLIIGNTQNTLKRSLRQTGPVDIFFHDSEHTYDHVMFELSTALPHMKKRFLIIVDNYDWTDAPVDFSHDQGMKLVRIADDMCFIYPE
ncbi:MAG: class I SAM-dependent methyltransferase [Thermoplasmataceae archaeon]